MPAASRDLPQWSQWSCGRGRARRAEVQAVELHSPNHTCAATLSRAAAEAVVDVLPTTARKRLLEHAHTSAIAQWRFLSVVGAALIPAAVVFAVLAPLNITAASWTACCVFYIAHGLARWTIRRELLVRWFQKQSIDSRFDSCPNCRYDQRGSLSELCSECGCPVELSCGLATPTRTKAAHDAPRGLRFPVRRLVGLVFLCAAFSRHWWTGVTPDGQGVSFMLAALLFVIGVFAIVPRRRPVVATAITFVCCGVLGLAPWTIGGLPDNTPPSEKMLGIIASVPVLCLGLIVLVIAQMRGIRLSQGCYR